jgi:3-methyl-2-oxobutanoate hydroxymethyltransferase
MQSRKKIMPHHFIKMKKAGKKIAMVTAYDYYTAKVADEAGIDGILIGDSLGMVIMGYSTTLPVTMDEMIHHTKAVVNASPRALVVADMPFMSYEMSKEEALRNAGKFLRLGVDAVKIEGGVEVVDKVEAMTKSGIPVMGHIGLNPQRYLTLGGYKLRGKTAEDAYKLVEDAKALEEAGAFSIVIEFTTFEVAEAVTKILKIPTICIGAGYACDGQILVFHDLVGLNPNPPPFAKKYMNTYELFKEALERYANDVRNLIFPSSENFSRMDPEEFRKFRDRIREERR